jgi:large subunit ribosomal protein L25
MSAIRLEATTRQDIGKGASRRLRRLENKVPAVIYGGKHAPQSIHLSHNAVLKALENEAIYSTVFDLVLDEKAKPERVILKALQRHPFKPVILHMDLQRVAETDVLVKLIPVHFVNQDECPGVQEGGVVNHVMSQVEVRCEARHLPAFIELDLANLALNQVLHLSDLVLPEGVELAIDPLSGDHNHPVVSIHLSKAEVSEEANEETAEGETADDAESTDVSNQTPEHDEASE